MKSRACVENRNSHTIIISSVDINTVCMLHFGLTLDKLNRVEL